MRLQTWAEKGVDVSVFTALSLLVDERSGVLHSEVSCAKYQGEVPAVPAPITLEADLCDDCWGWWLPLPAHAVDEYVLELEAVETEYCRALSLGLTGDGFSHLLSALMRLPDAEEVAPWSARLRAGMLTGFSAALHVGFPTGLGPARDSALVEVLGCRPSGRSGMLVVPGTMVFSALRYLGEVERHLAVLWWDSTSPWPGFVVEAPLEVVERLAAAICSELSESLSELVSFVALEPSDTPAVHEVARALFDEDDLLFCRLSRVFEAARAV